jgi:Mg-chelatase subunit ChlI
LERCRYSHGYRFWQESGTKPLDAYKNRIEILERQLSYEDRNMLVLENIRTSTKSLKEQTIL